MHGWLANLSLAFSLALRARRLTVERHVACLVCCASACCCCVLLLASAQNCLGISSGSSIVSRCTDNADVGFACAITRRAGEYADADADAAAATVNACACARRSVRNADSARTLAHCEAS